MTPFKPVGDAALITMASTCDEIRLSICWVCFETSLPALKTEHLTSVLYGSIAQAALNSFSISTRQVLPMNELLKAIVYGGFLVFPWVVVLAPGREARTATRTTARITKIATPTMMPIVRRVKRNLIGTSVVPIAHRSELPCSFYKDNPTMHIFITKHQKRESALFSQHLRPTSIDLAIQGVIPNKGASIVCPVLPISWKKDMSWV